MAVYDVPLTLDGGVIRETDETDTVPASVLWGQCKNMSGTTLQKGTPVYVIEESEDPGTGFLVWVGAADASDASKMPAIGVLDADLDDEEEGPLLYLGLIKNVPVDPDVFNPGDAVYVAPGGGYTNVRPSGAGELVQYLGIVTRTSLTSGAGQILGTGQTEYLPGAGIAVSTGNAWDTSLTVPAGDLVGTTETQVLTNKTISVDDNTIEGLPESSFVTTDSTGVIEGGSTGKAIPAGDVVGTTDGQVLTNKTISVDSNTISGIAASSFVLSDSSGYIDGGASQKAIPSGAVLGTTDTQTLTNKRINPRVSSEANITSPLAWNSDNYDQYAATAQSGDLTINADSGTPVDGQKMIFRFKDNGGARGLTWTTGSSKSFRAVGITLPTTTVISKTTYVGCIYNAADSRWDAVATVTEA